MKLKNSTFIGRNFLPTYLKHSHDLWKKVFHELKSVFGTDIPKRPTKLSQCAKELKEEIKTFASTNAVFLCEVPSLTGTACSHETQGSSCVFQEHTSDSGQTQRHRRPDVIQALNNSLLCVREAYQLSRKRATEVAMFMVSDLDRVTDFGLAHSMPVAYGLQGPGVSTDTVRKMLKIVLESLDSAGLEPIVFSSDGQFIQLMTKDSEDQPLTLLQLQKQHWANVKKKSKANILAYFKNEDNSLGKPYVAVRERHIMLFVNKKAADVTPEGSIFETPLTAADLVPEGLIEKVDSDTYSEILSVLQSLVDEGGQTEAEVGCGTQDNATSSQRRSTHEERDEVKDKL